MRTRPGPHPLLIPVGVTLTEAALRTRFRWRLVFEVPLAIPPGTLVISNHPTDADGPLLACLILRRRHQWPAAGKIAFAARSDLFERGFLYEELLRKRRVFSFLGSLTIGRILYDLGLEPLPPSLSDRRRSFSMVQKTLGRLGTHLAQGGSAFVSPPGLIEWTGMKKPRAAFKRLLGSAGYVLPVGITVTPARAGRRLSTVVFGTPTPPPDHHEDPSRLYKRLVGPLLRPGPLHAFSWWAVETRLPQGFTPDEISEKALGLALSLLQVGAKMVLDPPQVATWVKTGLFRRTSSGLLPDLSRLLPYHRLMSDHLDGMGLSFRPQGFGWAQTPPAPVPHQ